MLFGGIERSSLSGSASDYSDATPQRLNNVVTKNQEPSLKFNFCEILFTWLSVHIDAPTLKTFRGTVPRNWVNTEHLSQSVWVTVINGFSS